MGVAFIKYEKTGWSFQSTPERVFSSLSLLTHVCVLQRELTQAVIKQTVIKYTCNEDTIPMLTELTGEFTNDFSVSS